jgi:hypothetical protein
MATKKQTKNKKEKQATVVENHRNPETLKGLYLDEGKPADAKEDYLKKTWLTAQLKKGVSFFRISKDQGVSYREASGHGSSVFLDPEGCQVSKNA